MMWYTLLLLATKPHVVIVGAGVGGLAVAARLADVAKITILEKNAVPGGRCGSFVIDVEGQGKFRHERGPSLLLLPDTYRELFTDCGKSMDDYLEIKPCLPAYQVVFSDGDCVNLGYRNDPSMKEEELKAKSMLDSFERDGATKFERYLQICEAYLDCGLPNFIEQKLDIASFPAFLKESISAWPLKAHSEVLDDLFESTKMKALASFQDLYVGLSPYKDDSFAGGVLQGVAPAVFGLLSAIELHPRNAKCGVYAPVGGFDAVAKALTKLAEDRGVKIIYNATVTSVDDRIYYKDLDESRQNVAHDYAVINADLSYAKKSLLAQSQDNSEIRLDWDDRYRFSSGVVAFHWSINKKLGDLNTHNVFLESRTDELARKSWQAVSAQIDSPWSIKESDSMNFYVHRASKTDPSAAPDGKDALLILVPCPTLKRNIDSATLPKHKAISAYAACFPPETIDQVRKIVLDRLSVLPSLKNLESVILHEVVDTPLTYSDLYNVGAGTPFGLSHGLGQLSLARPGFVERSIANTFYVGASTRPGNGVPLTMTSARLVADSLAKAIGQES